MPHLLDNDVFLAALYQGHLAHTHCRAWLDEIKPSGWAIAIETRLAAQRLLMNPSVMGEAALDGKTAYQVVTTEMSGSYPGKLIFPRRPPDQEIFRGLTGHRQVMDLWLIQTARDHGHTLATRDTALCRHFPQYTFLLRQP